jgi:hypothetical protein
MVKSQENKLYLEEILKRIKREMPRILKEISVHENKRKTQKV